MTFVSHYLLKFERHHTTLFWIVVQVHIDEYCKVLENIDKRNTEVRNAAILLGHSQQSSKLVWKWRKQN